LQWVRQYGQDVHKRYIAVIMLTGLRSEHETVKALEAGADDYIYKPFRPKELVARVQRLVNAHRLAYALGRMSSAPVITDDDSMGDKDSVLEFDNYVFYRFEQKVTYKGEVVDLTEREFSLALLLFKHLNVALSREAIFEKVWKRAETPSSRALDTHIYRLRQRLNLNLSSGYILRTVYGYGYRLDVAGQYNRSPIRRNKQMVQNEI
jgi:DNA-binding response OmpR family regulator